MKGLLHSGPDLADNSSGGASGPVKGVSKLQPKPIESRHLLDIDAQQRLVDMEGIIQHLRALRDHKEHPAETDYDVIHDEAGRRNREEAAGEFINQFERALAEGEEESPEPVEEETPESVKPPANGQKGSHLDMEA